MVKLLHKTADDIDSGNSNISSDEAVGIMEVLTHIALSKEEACNYLNLRRSRFDDLVREGKLPKGRKLLGRKELVWFKDELNTYLNSK